MNPIRHAIPAAVLAALSIGTGAQAQDAAAGRVKAQACVICHGVDGLSIQPDAPNLAGQPMIYIRAQLRAFRSGERRNEIMAVMAKPLTDDEISNLAAWYASIKVQAQVPN